MCYSKPLQAAPNQVESSLDTGPMFNRANTAFAAESGQCKY